MKEKDKADKDKPKPELKIGWRPPTDRELLNQYLKIIMEDDE
jgi:hypothetical protein